jgi:nucleoside 2-deoxyribosyltransferase
MMNSSPGIYLAAPLFSEAELRYNRYVADLLCQEGYDIYLPQEQGEDARHRTQEDDRIICMRHLQALGQAQMVVAISDGPDTDSGTAWEAGYAHAKGIPVVTLRTDTRMIGPARSINLMLEQTSHMVTTTTDLVRYLQRVIPIQE